MARASRKKNRKRFRKVEFKLSAQQMSMIEVVCENENITPNKLYKRLIKEHLSDNAELFSKKEEAAKNQLKLFEDPGTQLIMFDDILFT